MLNISASKSVHIYTFATVTVHICMVIVARAFSILLFFLSPPLSLSLFFSLVWLFTLFGFPLFPNDHNNSAKKK